MAPQNTGPENTEPNAAPGELYCCQLVTLPAGGDRPGNAHLVRQHPALEESRTRQRRAALPRGSYRSYRPPSRTPDH
jgi:hypothetical protein